MLRIVREHHEEQALLEQDAQECRRRGVTFGEVARAYLAWMDEVKGAKPSMMRNHRSLLAEWASRIDAAERRPRDASCACSVIVGRRP